MTTPAPKSAARPKVTFVGGGSIQWVPILFRDLAVNRHLQDIRFVLHDIVPESSRNLAGICQAISDKLGSSILIETEGGLDRALSGADVVILCISTGGLDAMHWDIEIPRQFGIPQPVGDTTGPGGISRTLRNVPVVVDLARRMEEHCPRAWLLNLSNPMSQIVRAIAKTTSIRVVGLCHEFLGFMKKLEGLFGLKNWATETSSILVGINHFGWITELDVQGADGLDLYARHVWGEVDAGGDDAFANLTHRLGTDQVKAELFHLYGYLPYPGDRHLVEFMPRYLTEKCRTGLDYGVELTTIDDRRTKWMDFYRKRIREWTSEDPNSIPRQPSEEALAPLLAALLKGIPTVQPVAMPNRGQITNLPENAVVETLATATRNALVPHSSGALPNELLGLVLPHCVNQELTVDAALSGDTEPALKAMLNDPLNARLSAEETQRMLAALIEANAPLLPQFAPRRMNGRPRTQRAGPSSILEASPR